MKPLVETFLSFAMFVCEMVLVKTLGVAASRLKSLFLRHRRLLRFPVHGSTTLVDAREEVWSSDFRFLPIQDVEAINSWTLHRRDGRLAHLAQRETKLERRLSRLTGTRLATSRPMEGSRVAAAAGRN